MGDKTKIEWTDATWNPIRARNLTHGAIGWHCEHISEGCRNCYAERMAMRLRAMGMERYRNGFEVTLQPDVLELPLTWRQPRPG